MGMSTHVTGYRKTDDKWNAYKRVWIACEVAGILPPEEVSGYFDGEDPRSLAGIEVNIDEAVTPYQDNAAARNGFEVDLTKLPADVRYLRFFNAW